jgi:hypothetical protein
MYCLRKDRRQAQRQNWLIVAFVVGLKMARNSAKSTLRNDEIAESFGTLPRTPLNVFSSTMEI